LFTNDLGQAGALQQVYASNQPVAQKWLQCKEIRQIGHFPETNATI
jgi:hypothetical protein